MKTENNMRRMQDTTPPEPSQWIAVPAVVLVIILFFLAITQIGTNLFCS